MSKSQSEIATTSNSQGKTKDQPKPKDQRFETVIISITTSSIFDNSL